MLNRYTFILSSLLTIYSIYVAINSEGNEKTQNHKDYVKDFKNYVQKYGKIYDGQEYKYRESIFLESVQRVRAHNEEASKGMHSYTTAINEFSDMTWWEFSTNYLQTQMQYLKMFGQEQNYACTGSQPAVKDIPTNFDWQTYKALTPVKSVSNCKKGAYAVVVAQTIQSGRFITTGKLSPASVQQIIDCSTPQGNKGCDSGTPLNSFQYILKNGITGQQKYPYTDKSSACAYHISQKQWQILGCTKVDSKNQTIMRAAVMRQPVAASVNATKAFMDYSSGTFEHGTFSTCKTGPNHWVTIVGFGVDQKKKGFWRLKNNWGTKWGNSGYMDIVRTGDGEGQCGIQNQVYYPLD